MTLTHDNSPRRRRSAFTLIELLVVMAILGLLVAIILPSMNRIRQAARRASDMATLNSISVGLRQYAADHNRLPESFWDTAYDSNNWYGAHVLAQAMLGYLDNTPNGGDGANGLGFRIVKRGTVYGPYVDPDRTATDAWYARPAFVDLTGNPILYYRYDASRPNNDKYNDSHNPDGPNNPVKEIHNINDYAMKDSQYLRTDFILCTPGPDEQWGTAQDLNNLSE